MRFGAVATMTLLVAAGFVTCIPGCNLIETRPDATGSTGGSSTPPTSSSGGAKGSGGTTSSVGVTSSGGITTSSGGSSSGGAGGSGGVTSSGGSPARGGSGGTTTSGGTTSSGGTTASGGSTARGGSGGTAGSGGTTTTTVVSTSSCTDDPPPGQTPTCGEWNSYGMCSQSWFATYCNQTCGRCAGGSNGGAGGAAGSGGTTAHGGTSGSGGVIGSGGVTGAGGTTARSGTTGAGGSTTPSSTNAQITGTSGWASRYWDCCKPSCGWSSNSNPQVPSCDKGGTTRISVDQKNGCEGGGSAFECYDFSPWFDSGTNMSYGFAAYNGVACGTCFELQFTGNGNSGANAGAAAIKGQQMIVQVINIGGIAANQFDLLIPGGGVGAMNGCATQWGGSADLGVQYGGLLSECAGDATCMKGKCSSVFGSISSTLKAGCDWFTGWFSSADNPQLVYKQVSCPSQLSGKTGLSK